MKWTVRWHHSDEASNFWASDYTISILKNPPCPRRLHINLIRPPLFSISILSSLSIVTSPFFFLVFLPISLAFPYNAISIVTDRCHSPMTSTTVNFFFYLFPLYYLSWNRSTNEFNVCCCQGSKFHGNNIFNGINHCNQRMQVTGHCGLCYSSSSYVLFRRHSLNCCYFHFDRRII